MENFDCSLFVSSSKSSKSTRQRHFYDEAQLAVLNAEFARHSFPSRECRLRIALLIGVSSKSVMWWFQNRRRRVRQRRFRSAAQTYETSRQHSQSTPYAPCHRVQKGVLPHCQSTPGLYTQTEEDRPKNCWANESTTTSPQFLLGSQSTDWAANRQDNPQLALVSYSSGYQLTDQQEQGYSYWSNWEIPSSSNVIQKTAIMYPEMQDPYNYFNAPCWNNIQL